MLGDKAWTCEWRLPFAALGFSPEGKPRVLFNLAVRKTDPDSWVIWRKTNAPAWRVENAGELVFAS